MNPRPLGPAASSLGPAAPAPRTRGPSDKRTRGQADPRTRGPADPRRGVSPKLPIREPDCTRAVVEVDPEEDPDNASVLRRCYLSSANTDTMTTVLSTLVTVTCAGPWSPPAGARAVRPPRDQMPRPPPMLRPGSSLRAACARTECRTSRIPPGAVGSISHPVRGSTSPRLRSRQPRRVARSCCQVAAPARGDRPSRTSSTCCGSHSACGDTVYPAFPIRPSGRRPTRTPPTTASWRTLGASCSPFRARSRTTPPVFRRAGTACGFH